MTRNGSVVELITRVVWYVDFARVRNPGVTIPRRLLLVGRQQFLQSAHDSRFHSKRELYKDIICMYCVLLQIFYSLSLCRNKVIRISYFILSEPKLKIANKQFYYYYYIPSRNTYLDSKSCKHLANKSIISKDFNVKLRKI